MKLHPSIVEKDFWVCFMLDHLFHDSKYKDSFVFKGGASFSLFITNFLPAGLYSLVWSIPAYMILSKIYRRLEE